MQVSETYSREEEEKKTLSLITEVIVEPAHKSDTDALIPLIEATQKRGLGPEKALVDAAYGSDENCEKAKALGVEVVSPVMGKPQGNALTLTDFTLTHEATVSACPQGHAPVKVKHKKGKHIAVFGLETCADCPHLSRLSGSSLGRRVIIFAMMTKPFASPKEEPMRRPRSFRKTTGSEQALKGRCRNWTERLG